MTYLYFFLMALAVCFAAILSYIKIVDFGGKYLPKIPSGNFIFMAPLLLCGPLFFLIRMLAKDVPDNLFYPENELLCGVLVGAILIGICGLWKKVSKYSVIALAICCGGCSLLLPSDFVLQGVELSPLYQKGLIAASWFLIALACSILSLTDGLLSVFTIIFSLLMVGFYAISGISTMLFLYTAVIFGVAIGYLLFNWRPAQMRMNFASSLSFGFLLGFVMLGISAEGMWLPLQIINIYLYLVLVIYILQKISFIEKGNDNEDKIISYFKLMPVLIALAFVQAYMEISDTLFIVAVMSVLWVKSKISANGKKKTFKEINKETIESIKSGFDDLRNFLDKRK